MSHEVQIGVWHVFFAMFSKQSGSVRVRCRLGYDSARASFSFLFLFLFLAEQTFRIHSLLFFSSFLLCRPESALGTRRVPYYMREQMKFTISALSPASATARRERSPNLSAMFVCLFLVFAFSVYYLSRSLFVSSLHDCPLFNSVCLFWDVGSAEGFVSE